MNILYIADPNSVHDVKWLFSLSQLGVTPYLVIRKIHRGKLETSPISSDWIVGHIYDHSIVRFPVTLLMAFRIKQLIRKYQIDLIHIIYSEPNSLWCNFRSYFNVPMIITSRGTDVLKTIPDTFKRRTLINSIVSRLYSRAFQKADFLTATSKKQLDSIAWFSGRTKNVAIVRTGVKLDRLRSDTSAHFSLPDKMPYVLFPRYMKPIYNHEFALQAIDLLPLDFKKHFKMVFVGKNSGDSKYIESLAKRMNAMSDVRFEFLDDQSQEGIFELYKRASVVVMTPVSDGSPVSAMEAAACGVPVILPPLDYDKEIFSETTYKLSFWDAEELAILIRKVVTEAESRKEPSVSFLQLIDINNNMRKMCDIYRESLTGANR